MAGGITAAVIGGGALIYAATQQSNAAQSAANTQANASGAATAAQSAALDKQIALNQPFVTSGVNAVNKLNAQPGYTPAAFNFQADPGYAFSLAEGNKQMNATAAAKGGLISGNALTAGQQYGQGLGSTYYQQAYNNYLSNNAQNLQAYNTNTANTQYLANLGQNSANNTGNAIGNFGNAAASNIIGAGNANAAGQVGSANAYTSAVGQGIGAYQTNALLSSLRNNNTSAYNGTSTYDGSVGAFSDIRTKENIELVGYLSSGLPVYDYDYKPEFKDHELAGHGRFRGVMAQDVQKVIPEAIITMPDGYMAVNYNLIH